MMRSLVFLVCFGSSTALAQYNVRAHGRFLVDLDGEKVGVAGALVKLMDSDSDYDVEMASGITEIAARPRRLPHPHTHAHQRGPPSMTRPSSRST